MANVAEVTFEGQEEMNRKILDLANKFPLKVAKALFFEAELIMTTAKGIVPFDLGALKTSGHVDPPSVKPGDEIKVVLGFGGPAAPYALDQHENLTYEHSAGGQPKYLQRPMEEAAPKLPAKLGASLKL